MKVIVNTNRLIAALVRDGLARAILREAKFSCITLGLNKEELSRHKQEILRKAQMSEDELDLSVAKLFQSTILLPDELVAKYMPTAKRIMDAIDPADTPFIAAAMACQCAIWSDDRHFRQQNKVRILTTQDMKRLLRK